MSISQNEFARLVSRILRGLRYASYLIIVLFLVWAGLRIAELYRLTADVHPLLGVAFLLAVGLALAWFVGRPLYRFFVMPLVMRPPELPPEEERTPADLARHLAFVERYVAALPGNPEWTGSAEDVETVRGRCRALAERARGAKVDELGALAGETARIEEEDVARLLAPLDRMAADAIRGEALKVGIATAVSPYGSLDAFLVLWRNVNLVARVARIYYGRPGARGTLAILRDVSAATMASAYLQQASEFAGDMVATLAGKTAGVFTGPLLDGTLNAVATLRIGYVAKGRCRAFAAWTGRTRAQAVRGALKEAGRFSRGVVSDVIKTVGGGLLHVPKRVLSGILEKVGGLFRRPGGDDLETPAPEPAGP